MARFYPNQLRGKATRGERLVFERLHELDDSWIVLHSVGFVAQERRGARPGEIDFVLLHGEFGLLVLEVKDGSYEVAGRHWYALGRGGRVPLGRSPFEQATDNRYKLARWLKKASGVERVPDGHCVVFTDARPTGVLGPEAPDAITLTGAALGNPRRAIGGVVEHWRRRPWSPSDDDFRKVLESLAPQASVVPTLDYDVDLAAAELERLTDRQIRLTREQLDVLSATSGRRDSLVLGPAGTGKTLLALHRARTLATQGARVGVVCDQRHLRLELRRKVQVPAAVIGGAEDLVRGVFEDAPAALAEAAELWEATLALVEDSGPPLDHLIVDEAQSHHPDLLDALRELVRPTGSLVFFADPYQRDASGRWRPSGEFNEFWLTQNCRNTLPIARLVSRISGALAPVDGAAGRVPAFREVRDGEHHDAAVAVVMELLETLTPSRVVVLTRSGAYAPLRAALRRNDVPLSTDRGNDGLLVCSVEEFRGCEAPAVVYVADGVTSGDRTLDYVAVSRPCAHLTVVGTTTEWQKLRYLLEVQA